MKNTIIILLTFLSVGLTNDDIDQDQFIQSSLKMLNNYKTTQYKDFPKRECERDYFKKSQCLQFQPKKLSRNKS